MSNHVKSSLDQFLLHNCLEARAHPTQYTVQLSTETERQRDSHSQHVFEFVIFFISYCSRPKIRPLEPTTLYYA